MRKKELLILAALLFSVTLCACHKKNETEESLGSISPIEIEENASEKVLQENCTGIGSATAKLYQIPKNKNLYVPKDFTKEVEGISFVRKNFPEYGFSALIPKGFSQGKSTPGSFLSLSDGEIILNFTAKPSTEKGERFVQKSFQKDILDGFLFWKGDVPFSVQKITNGKLENVFEETDVLISENERDYTEFLTPLPGFDYHKGKKLSYRMEKAEDFVVTSSKLGEAFSLPSFLTYSVVYEKSILLVTSYPEEKEDTAKKIAHTVAKSIASLDEHISEIRFSAERERFSFLNGASFSYPKNFKLSKKLDDGASFTEETKSLQMVTKPAIFFCYMKKLAGDDTSFLKSFSSLSGFADSFSQKTGIVKEKTHLGVSETGRYYHVGETITEGVLTALSPNGRYDFLYRGIFDEKERVFYLFAITGSPALEKENSEMLSQMVESFTP